METVTEIEKIPGIASVISSTASVEALTKARDVLGTASAGFMFLLGLVSVFIIANTIKLTTFDRREEIAIMKIIGATNGFIQAPFMIESLILSLFSAGAAFGLQWLIYILLMNSGLSSIQQISIVDFSQIQYHYLAGFVIVAFLLGVVGSTISTHKYLKV